MICRYEEIGRLFEGENIKTDEDIFAIFPLILILFNHNNFIYNQDLRIVEFSTLQHI